MPKKDPTKKKRIVKLPDLPPKKDTSGGNLGYSKTPSLPIPPPGFVSSQPGVPDRRRQ